MYSVVEEKILKRKEKKRKTVFYEKYSKVNREESNEREIIARCCILEFEN